MRIDIYVHLVDERKETTDTDKILKDIQVPVYPYPVYPGYPCYPDPVTPGPGYSQWTCNATTGKCKECKGVKND